MAELMTSIYTPRLPETSGVADWGRKTRAEMITLLRANAESDLKTAQAILATPDDEFVVEQYRGVHVRNNLKRIEPEATTESEQPS